MSYFEFPVRIHPSLNIFGGIASQVHHESILVVAEAIDTIEETRPDVPVDLVTHECHGDPTDYLLDPLRSKVPNVAVTGHCRCTCGGYVITVVRRISGSE